MTDSLRHFKRNPRSATQEQVLPGQVPNSCGAGVFAVSPMDRLDRFLMMGTDGGSYYASERDLTIENCREIEKLIKSDGLAVVKRVVEVSDQGRAKNNDYALFVLAMCTAMGDEDTKRRAFAVLPDVARIGTHLFHFCQYRKQMAGWGRGAVRALKRWYTEKTPEQLAFQVAKYQSRDGWSHRDVLRVSHPRANTKAHTTIFEWITHPEKMEDESFVLDLANDAPVIAALEQIKRTDNEETICRILENHGLGLEFVPTEKRTDRVLLQCLPNLGLTALIRNLGVYSARGLLQQQHRERVLAVCEQLTNEDRIRKSRIHPVVALNAMVTYRQGRGLKGSLRWTCNRQIVDALEECFYKSFKNVEPTGLRHLLALDVSGSMTCWTCPGTVLSPRVASAAMAMVLVRTEKDVITKAFSGRFMDLAISGRMTLDQVLSLVNNMDFDNTDCSLPMVWATENNVAVDAFIIYTDSETNAAGSLQPMAALHQYRDKLGIPAKLITVGMVSNGFTIADPNDKHALDVVGFDSHAPAVMADFLRK